MLVSQFTMLDHYKKIIRCAIKNGDFTPWITFETAAVHSDHNSPLSASLSSFSVSK